MTARTLDNWAKNCSSAKKRKTVLAHFALKRKTRMLVKNALKYVLPPTNMNG